MLRLALERQGHTVLEAKDQPEAVKHLQQGQPAVVLSDLRLPDGDGFGVLRASKEIDPDVPVIVMTAYGSIEDAVSAMKEGAMDFLAKPVDPDHLLLLVARALDQRRIVTENLLLKEELAVRRGAPLLIGENASLRKVYGSLQRAATTDTTVLIEGESGTGKELFARSLHALSARADAPFVAINCAAIPENLLETELFGHEKGAFTGAVARKPGKFEIAHRGTLFLDEIGDLPLALQAKILRALEEKRFERVGGTALGAGRRAAGGGDEPRDEGSGRGATVSRGSLLPVVGLSDHRAAAPRARRRHPAAGAPFRRSVLPGSQQEAAGPVSRGGGTAADLLLAGERARAAELHRARGHPGGRRDDPPAAPEPVVHRSACRPEPPSPWEQIDLSGTLVEASRRVLREAEKHKIEQVLREADNNKGRAAELLGITYKMFLSKLKEHRIDAEPSAADADPGQGLGDLGRRDIGRDLRRPDAGGQDEMQRSRDHLLVAAHGLEQF